MVTYGFGRYLQDGGNRLQYPGHRAQERDDLPDRKPSGLAHVDTPPRRRPCLRSLTASKAQDCYRSRRSSMSIRSALLCQDRGH